jgi:hypothetical protein
LAALNHFTVPDAMPYLLWGSTPGPAMCGYRVAAMMPRPEKDRQYKKLPDCREIPAKELESFWEPQLQLRSTVA